MLKDLMSNFADGLRSTIVEIKDRRKELNLSSFNFNCHFELLKRSKVVSTGEYLRE